MVIISSFIEPVDGLKHQQPSVRVVFNGKEIGEGALYISEHVLAWQNYNNSQIGFCINYLHISLHAISRDPATFPEPCIYLILDDQVDVPGIENESNGVSEHQNEENSDDEEDDEAKFTEIYLIPSDVTSLESIYNAIRICQELNPDPVESMSDDDEFYDGEYYGGDGDTFESSLESEMNCMNQLNLNGSDGAGDAAFEDAD